MNTVKSFIFLIVCAVVLTESQAKKGCDAYGHVCYGGHGKRSLGSLVGGGANGGSGGNSGNSGSNSISGSEQDDLLRTDAILQALPNEATSLDGELDAYPRYRLIKVLKSLFGANSRRPSEIDYPFAAESFSRDTK